MSGYACTPGRLLAMEVRRLAWHAGAGVRRKRNGVALLLAAGAAVWLVPELGAPMLAEMRAATEAVRAAGTLETLLRHDLPAQLTPFALLIVLGGLASGVAATDRVRRRRRFGEEMLRAAGASPGALALRDGVRSLVPAVLVGVIVPLLLAETVLFLLAPAHRAALFCAGIAFGLLGAALAHPWRFGGPAARAAIGGTLGGLLAFSVLFATASTSALPVEVRRAILGADAHLVLWRALLDPATGPWLGVALLPAALALHLATRAWGYRRIGFHDDVRAVAGGEADAASTTMVRGAARSLFAREMRRLAGIRAPEKLLIGYFTGVPVLQFVFLSWSSPALTEATLAPERIHWVGTGCALTAALAFCAVLWSQETRAAWGWYRLTGIPIPLLLAVRGGTVVLLGAAHLLLLALLAVAAAGPSAALLPFVGFGLLTAALASCSTMATAALRLRCGLDRSQTAAALCLAADLSVALLPAYAVHRGGSGWLAASIGIGGAAALFAVAAALLPRVQLLPEAA